MCKVWKRKSVISSLITSNQKPIALSSINSSLEASFGERGGIQSALKGGAISIRRERRARHSSVTVKAPSSRPEIAHLPTIARDTARNLHDGESPYRSLPMTSKISPSRHVPAVHSCVLLAIIRHARRERPLSNDLTAIRPKSTVSEIFLAI